MDAVREALADGRWEEARRGCERVLAAEPGCAAAWESLATAAWWLGDDRPAVAACARGYAGYRREGDDAGAVRCAVWLAITYKANFGNFAVANGWLRRAERLLPGAGAAAGAGAPAAAWVAIARAYQMDDLDAAAGLTAGALETARSSGDVDLELVALSQLGLIQVAQGDAEGIGLIDEALAAALAGEPGNLDTVAYACCDMLNACELAVDVERAAQWCAVADDFVERYGCPFLYADCRLLYGGVLVTTGRWAEAERELATALRATEGTCPALHTRALVRLCELRRRQGRLEEAGELVAGLETETATEAVVVRAALLLDRGDAHGACRVLLQRRDDRAAGALALLADVHLALGDLDGATACVRRLDPTDPATATPAGRVALARGQRDQAVAHFDGAIEGLQKRRLPYETATALLDRALVRDGRAIDHARRASEVFARLGATTQADRAAAVLRELGVGPRPGPKGVGPLTRREQEVLALLGRGLTNPEIAGRLHISRKTAAHHVSSILSKLQLRNRAEAAALAARRSP